MSKRQFAIVTAIPLFWASLAFAQTAPAEPGAAMRQSPQEQAAEHRKNCTEHYARAASAQAYLAAKLDLTDKQRAAWNKWDQWTMDTAGKERAACLEATPTTGARPTALDREARHERKLSIEVQGLQAAKPSLLALYDVLTTEQRAVMDHAFDRRALDAVKQRYAVKSLAPDQTDLDQFSILEPAHH